MHTDCVIIGAGHSGLAMSHCLTERSVEHVVLERGEVANSWKRERWDSLRLLTPNWQTRLPGFAYAGDEPDGYMSVAELGAFLEQYAGHLSAPVYLHTTVTAVTAVGQGYRVVTDRGTWHCHALVIASGACNIANVPKIAESVADSIHMLTPQQYRNPGQLEAGGVLVVGASATGLQLAEEIQRSGRPVTLAVGEHVRMPRLYRGRDVQWWMLAAGVLDQCLEEMDDPLRARRLPSPQLVGTRERATLDLNVLREQGVEIVGRLMGVRDGRAQFSGSLRNVCALADLKMNRLLALFDEWAERTGADAEVGPPERYAGTVPDTSPRLGLTLGQEVRTIVWATGYRPDFSWLDVPAFDRRGQLKHDGGAVEAPGLYVLGLPFLRRRKSSFMHGTEDDVRDLSVHLAQHLDRTVPLQVSGVAM